MRVGIAQVDNKPYDYLVVLGVVKESTAARGSVKRPAAGMQDQTRLVSGRLDLPQLLYTDAVVLRIDPFGKIEFFL
ncbi:hypothetical protein D3C85_1715720 [compost metagenome]